MKNFFKKLFKKQNTVQTTLTITSSNGFHLRPIAKFVNEVKKFEATVTIEAKGQTVTATQVPKILSLSLEKGESFNLICSGKEAQNASAYLSDFFVELMKSETEFKAIVQEKETYESSTIKGQTIAKGIAIAPMVQLEYSMRGDYDGSVSLGDAIDMTIGELEDEESELYSAQAQLLQADVFMKFRDEDPSFFMEAINNEIAKLKNTKFESRIADYQDIEQRVLSSLGMYREMKLPYSPYILLAKSLLPSEVDVLKNSAVQGVILQEGTPTSHASILLRSAAIPSMIVHEEIELSSSAILDASSGNLLLTPTPNDLAKAEKMHTAFKEQKRLNFRNAHKVAKTKAGKTIKVLANITNVESAKEAKNQGADGIGLLRTEFLFTDYQPTIEEQHETYTEIFKRFEEVTVRTLDIGGDKSLPYIKIPKEDNPFLGVRGIRFSLQEQTLFKEQLLAIGLASSDLPNSNIKIMFPMVSTTKEFTQAKNIALELYQEHNINPTNIQFGIMLEVPSVIFALKAFDKLVDFYSIGSNDLTQYLFAIERTHPTLSVDATAPELMNALAYIKTQTQKPISICGELAGLEEATQQLVEMGYETLSVSAKLIPSLKNSIRKI